MQSSLSTILLICFAIFLFLRSLFLFLRSNVEIVNSLSSLSCSNAEILIRLCSSNYSRSFILALISFTSLVSGIKLWVVSTQSMQLDAGIYNEDHTWNFITQCTKSYWLLTTIIIIRQLFA